VKAKSPLLISEVFQRSMPRFVKTISRLLKRTYICLRVVEKDLQLRRNDGEDYLH